MKTLVVNRNIIVSIFAVFLLIYGVQSISYGQEDGTLRPLRQAKPTHPLKSVLQDLFFAFDVTRLSGSVTSKIASRRLDYDNVVLFQRAAVAAVHLRLYR